MRLLLRCTALLLASSTPALGADYSPRSDAAIGPIRLAPKNAQEVTDQCDARLAALKSLRASLEMMPLTADAEILIAVYDDVYNLAVTTAYEPRVIKNTHPDAPVRKAAEDCLLRARALRAELSMSRPIYERLQAAEKQGLEPNVKYMLDRQLENYRRAGVDKDDVTRRRIAELQRRITAASLEFENNISADKRKVAARADELAGLPEDWLKTHPAGAQGIVQIGMAYPEIVPVLHYAESADLRKRVMTAFYSRAYPANDAVLKRLISDRAELAKLFGYASYAHYDLANRMARDPRRVHAFIDEVAAVARPIGQAEAAQMVARLRKDDPSLQALGTWSSAYASKLIRKEDFDVDPAVARQYFHFDKVRAGIHRLTEDLFGVEIRPWASDIWHADVNPFEMVENGEVIGRFYLDMHPRDGKFSHAQMTPVRIGIRDRIVPIAVLETNFPAGAMEHGDVVTYLHEFGHLLHWIFSGQRPYAAQNVLELEHDVLEAPALVLEEWVWDFGTLARLATNAKGETIPAALVEKMNRGRHFPKAFEAMRELGESTVSLGYYLNDMAGADLTRAYLDLYARYGLADFPEGSHPQTSFDHLTGYGASVYTYQWSKALAIDLMSRFRAAGLRDRATAKAYREMILAPGGSSSMNVLARNFLGRDWSVDAYRKELKATVVARPGE